VKSRLLFLVGLTRFVLRQLREPAIDAVQIKSRRVHRLSGYYLFSEAASLTKVVGLVIQICTVWTRGCRSPNARTLDLGKGKDTLRERRVGKS
jgi:hypothetical protein